MYMYISGIVINLTDLVMNQARDATVVVDWLVRGELDDECFPGFRRHCTAQMLKLEDALITVDAELKRHTAYTCTCIMCEYVIC